MKKQIISFALLFCILAGCSVNQQALNYSNSLESKSDMQLCIDNALLGTNDAYYNYINNEIVSRNVDCSIYSEQVSTARAANQSTQTAVMTVVLVLSALFGFASGASGW